MSTTMRTTLQTVPESLPVTDSHTTTATTQSITQSESKSQSHATAAPIKTRSSSSKVSKEQYIYIFFVNIKNIFYMKFHYKSLLAFMMMMIHESIVCVRVLNPHMSYVHHVLYCTSIYI